MNHRKKLLCLLLTAILCLSPAACGGEAAGKDWRTDGTVVEHITLLHEGKDQALCVCVGTKGATLYYDKAERETYAQLSFPTALERAANEYAYTACPDDDGDGESTIEIHFSHADMSESCLLWSWVDGEGYVYQPSLSSLYRSIVQYDPPADGQEDDQVEMEK